MADLFKLGPWEGPGEELTANVLTRDLPKEWTIFAGRKLSGGRTDIDFLVLGVNGVYVIEEKHWGPEVHVHEMKWKVIGAKISFRDNPLNEINRKARVVASWLRDSIPSYSQQVRGRPVTAAVVLSQKDLIVRINANDPVEGQNMASQIRKLEHFAGYLKNLDNSDEQVRTGFHRIRGEAFELVKSLSAREILDQDFDRYESVSEVASYNEIRFFTGVHKDFGGNCFMTAYPKHFWSEDESFLSRQTEALQRLAATGRTWELQESFTAEVLNLKVVSTRQPEGYSNLSDTCEAFVASHVNPDTPLALNAERSEWSRDLAIACFEALSDIHEEGVWHKLLTPERVWVGRRNHVRFQGFIASHVDDEKSVFMPKLDPAIANFSAPELEFLPSEKSDVFALAKSLLWSMLRFDLNDTSKLNEVISDLVESELGVLALCLNPDPNARPLANEVVQALLERKFRRSERQVTPHVEDGDTPELEAGHILDDRYKLVERLGSGSFGSTWKAEDLEADSSVSTIKVHLNEKALEIARGEKNRAANLRHESLQLFRNLKSNPGFGYSEFAFAEGVPLSVFDFQSAEDIRLVFAKACEALIYLHGKSMVHGDISPGNIIVDSDLNVTLIDAYFTPFGDDVSIRTRAYSPPEYAYSTSATEAGEVFSLSCTFIKVLLGRSPVELLEGRYILVPISTSESMAFEDPLELAIIRALMLGCAPEPKDRPARVVEILDRVMNARPLATEELPTLEETQVINPFVDEIRKLYRGSVVGSPGQLGIGSDFSQMTYVETSLDKSLLPKVLVGDVKIVLLTGNAGDGKTSFLNILGTKLESIGGVSIGDFLDSGWSYQVGDRSFYAVFDASESSGERSSSSILETALEHSALGSTVLVAVNDGRLKRFWSTELKQQLAMKLTAVGLDLESALESYFETGKGDFDGIQIVDLKKRGLEQLSRTGILREQIDRLTSEELWNECLSCSSRGRCPIFKNKADLTSKYVDGVSNLAIISHLRKKKRFTFRDARSALAWAITGDIGCEQVHTEVDSGNDPSTEDRRRIYSLLFDPDSEDALVREWAELDPAFLHSTTLNRELNKRQPELGPQARTLAFRQREARKAFFGDTELEGVAPQVQPYRFLDVTLEFLQNGAEDSGFLKKLLLGLSRLCGPTIYKSDGLAVSVSEIDAGWNVMRVLEADDFSLEVSSQEAHSPYVEYVPDGLILRFRGKLALELNLDSIELLMRAAEGEIFLGQKTLGLRAELLTFAQKLAIQSSSQLILSNPNGTTFSATNSSGRIHINQEFN